MAIASKNSLATNIVGTFLILVICGIHLILDLINFDYDDKMIDGRSFFPFEKDTNYDELFSYLHTIPYEKHHPSDSDVIRTKKYKT